MLKIGSRVILSESSRFVNQSNVPGTITNKGIRGYKWRIKWDNGVEKLYNNEDLLELLSEETAKIGATVKLSRFSQFAGQFEGEAKIVRYDEGFTYPWGIRTASGYSNGYALDDLIYITTSKDRLDIMIEIASDPEMVEMLEKWLAGPIEACPYHYSILGKKDCNKLCFALWPDIDDCPCKKDDRVSTVKAILSMAKLMKNEEKIYLNGDVFKFSNGTPYLLADVGGYNYCLVSLCSGNRWTEPIKTEEKITETLFKEIAGGSSDFTFVGHISTLTIKEGKIA